MAGVRPEVVPARASPGLVAAAATRRLEHEPSAGRRAARAAGRAPAPPSGPTPYQAPPADPSGQRPAAVGDAFNWAWLKFQRNIGEIILLAIAALVVIAVIVIAGFFLLTATLFSTASSIHCGTDALGQTTCNSGSAGIGFLGFVGLSVLLFTLNIFVSFLVQMWFIRASLILGYGEKLEMKKMLSTENIGAYILGALLVSIAVLVGSFLCVVPGLIVLFFSSFFGFFILDKKMSAVDGIQGEFPPGEQEPRDDDRILHRVLHRARARLPPLRDRHHCRDASRRDRLRVHVPTTSGRAGGRLTRLSNRRASESSWPSRQAGTPIRSACGTSGGGTASNGETPSEPARIRTPTRSPRIVDLVAVTPAAGVVWQSRRVADAVNAEHYVLTGRTLSVYNDLSRPPTNEWQLWTIGRAEPRVTGGQTLMGVGDVVLTIAYEGFAGRSTGCPQTRS